MCTCAYATLQRERVRVASRFAFTLSSPTRFLQDTLVTSFLNKSRILDSLGRVIHFLPTPHSPSSSVLLSHVSRMSTEQKIVYYEDVEVSAIRVKSDGTKETSVTSKSVSKSNSSSTSAPLKRQRTLMEMIPGASKEPKTTGQPAKKAKLSTAASSDGPSSSLAKAVTFGLQPLNFIPFSMKEFKDSLTEEQCNLLLLECETMGKSW